MLWLAKFDGELAIIKTPWLRRGSSALEDAHKKATEVFGKEVRSVEKNVERWAVGYNIAPVNRPLR